MALYTTRQSAYPDGYAALARLKDCDIWLAARCVMTIDQDYIVRQQNGSWLAMGGAKAAQLSIAQNWLGGPHNITETDIKQFMAQAPVVSGGMKVPTTTDPVVEFMGRIYINTWRDTVMKPDHQAINEPRLREPLTLFMRMLRESICGRPDEKTLDEMINIANGDDASEIEFRFLMAWLAAPIQQIGRNLQTNCWALGELGGAGKGTLFSLMSQIYGADNSSLLNCDEIEKRGWTDALEGKLWVCMNEISPSYKFDWNSFIKQNSCEEYIAIAKRGTHSHQTLNHANWFFPSNNEGPACLDSQDRRNCLIATTDDPAKVALAQNLRNWMAHNPEHLQRMLGAFVALLHNVKVDEKLIEKAPDTLLKAEVQEATSRDGEMEYWLRNDDNYPRDQWHKAHVYLPSHNSFTTKPMPARTFGGKMAKLARKRKIQMRQSGGSKTQPKEYMVLSSQYPKSDAPSDGKVVPLVLALARK